MKLPDRVLEPSERIAEILFGLIMALTVTGATSVVTADRTQIRTMLIAALGCNIAWESLMPECILWLALPSEAAMRCCCEKCVRPPIVKLLTASFQMRFRRCSRRFFKRRNWN